MKLGTRQVIVLNHLAQKGGKGFALKGCKPWQLSKSEHLKVLSTLEAKGLAERLDSGAMSMVLGRKPSAWGNFTSDWQLTPAGRNLVKVDSK
jgi:predicted transcriptional regulator of viral defense system